MSLSTPYISFPGNAAEAFEYYNEVFGGTLHLMTYGSMPMEGMPFTPPAEAVAHAQLLGGDLVLAGGDDIGGDDVGGPDEAKSPDLSNDIYSILLNLDSVERAQEIIEKVTSTGGSVAMPFEQAPWGDHYGQVKDRFGVMFHLNVEGDHPQYERADAAGS